MQMTKKEYADFLKKIEPEKREGLPEPSGMTTALVSTAPEKSNNKKKSVKSRIKTGLKSRLLEGEDYGESLSKAQVKKSAKQVGKVLTTGHAKPVRSVYQVKTGVQNVLRLTNKGQKAYQPTQMRKYHKTKVRAGELHTGTAKAGELHKPYYVEDLTKATTPNYGKLRELSTIPSALNEAEIEAYMRIKQGGDHKSQIISDLADNGVSRSEATKALASLKRKGYLIVKGSIVEAK